ncbi:Uncharacterised protein [Vibrio cholerae]|nr:Uncharacterised protein [Vibrio cholerae]
MLEPLELILISRRGALSSFVFAIMVRVLIRTN